MHVEHAVEIDAPVGVVWAVTVAVEDWPAWTPTVRAVERLTGGPLVVGTRARITQATGDVAEWTVSDLDPERVFAWTTRTRGVDLKAWHHLEAVTPGRTRNVLRIDAAGLAARVAWPLVRGQLLGAIAAENAGLKARCEAIARRA